MSVIIKGMDMPKNCIECNHMDLQETLNCQLIYSGCANCGRHPDCPLKSIEGLIKKIKENCKYNDKDRLSDYSIDLDEVIDIIKEYCEV